MAGAALEGLGAGGRVPHRSGLGVCWPERACWAGQILRGRLGVGQTVNKLMLNARTVIHQHGTYWVEESKVN